MSTTNLMVKTHQPIWGITFYIEAYTDSAVVKQQQVNIVVCGGEIISVTSPVTKLTYKLQQGDANFFNWEPTVKSYFSV